MYNIYFIKMTETSDYGEMKQQLLADERETRGIMGGCPFSSYTLA